MPRNHYYLIASVPPALGAALIADAQALVEETNSAKTFIADPEVTLTNDPDDSTRLRAFVHFHVLKSDRPNQVKRAIVDLFAAWKEAGAQLDEAGADDENVFDERPELKRRKHGEAAPKAISVQLSEAVYRSMSLETQIAGLQTELARVSAAAETASLAHQEELAGYVAFVEAYRATRIDPSDNDAAVALEAAYEPYRSPEG